MNRLKDLKKGNIVLLRNEGELIFISLIVSDSEVSNFEGVLRWRSFDFNVLRYDWEMGFIHDTEPDDFQVEVLR